MWFSILNDNTWLHLHKNRNLIVFWINSLKLFFPTKIFLRLGLTRGQRRSLNLKMTTIRLIRAKAFMFWKLLVIYWVAGYIFCLEAQLDFNGQDFWAKSTSRSIHWLILGKPGFFQNKDPPAPKIYLFLIQKITQNAI